MAKDDHSSVTGNAKGGGNAYFSFERNQYFPVDPADARSLTRKAAEAGSVSAMFDLGNLLNAEGHSADAEHWWRKAAEGGEIRAMQSIALILYDKGDFDTAEQWWRKAVDGGAIGASYNLGLALRAKGDMEAAESVWLADALRGNVHSILSVARLLREKGDLNQAELWFSQGAALGSTDCMQGLGYLLKARGDLEAAETWLRQAFDNGFTALAVDIGRLHQDRGDLSGAREWFLRAADEGNAAARNLLEGLDAVMTFDQRLRDIAFSTFGWPLIGNDQNYRRWKSENIYLTVRLVNNPPEIRAWNTEMIQEELLEGLQTAVSMNVYEKMTLIEVVRLMVGSTKSFRSIFLNEDEDGVHYIAGLSILFGTFYWVLQMDILDKQRLTQREQAVERYLEFEKIDNGEPELDPYDPRWDGLVPIEDDPLTRLRVLFAQLERSLDLRDTVGEFDTFSTELDDELPDVP